MRTHWSVRLALFVVVAGTFAHGARNAIRASAAREAVGIAADSVEVLLAARIPLEAAQDSLRGVVEAQASALRADSVRWASELERAERRARRATVRASSLADSIRVRVDSATAVLLDSLVITHHVEVVALNRQVEIFRAENVALWGSRRTLEELVAAGDSVNASLRTEIAWKDLQIAGLTQLVDPPWTLRLFRGSRVALPAFAAGFLVGVATTG